MSSSFNSSKNSLPMGNNPCIQSARESVQDPINIPVATSNYGNTCSDSSRDDSGTSTNGADANLGTDLVAKVNSGNTLPDSFTTHAVLNESEQRSENISMHQSSHKICYTDSGSSSYSSAEPDAENETSNTNEQDDSSKSTPMDIDLPYGELKTSEDVHSRDASVETDKTEDAREQVKTRSFSNTSRSVSNHTDVAIGIDLGTSYACAAVWQDNDVDVIQNTDGKRKIPCYVSFTKFGRLIGVAAEDQAEKYTKSTIFNVKRLIGRSCSHGSIQDDKNKWAKWPMKIIESHDRPTFEIEYEGDQRHFFPEEISSMILLEMKEIAGAYLKSNVKDVVITVPAKFTDSQRIATRDAGRIAGLNVLELINDTTAAAITYHSLQDWSKHVKEKNVLIFDLGGGTFDVSVLKITSDCIEVKYLEGVTQFGGIDFDDKLVDYFINYYRSTKQIDISNDPKALAKLRKACEKAKTILFNLEEAQVEITSLYGGKDFTIDINRDLFDEINGHLLTKCMKVVKICVLGAKMKPKDIHDIVLVGGSTRIPHLLQYLKEFFGKEHFKRINPDEAVARGAAIRAAMLRGIITNPQAPNLKIQNVTPFSLSAGGNQLVLNNEPTTNIADKIYSINCLDNETSIPVEMVEGNHHKKLYACFQVSRFPLQPKGILPVNISFSIDADGILNLKAYEEDNQQRKLVVTKEFFRRLDDWEVHEKRKEANLYMTQIDARDQEKSDAGIESFKLLIHRMYVEGKNANKWMEDNPQADEEKIVTKMEEYKSKCKRLLEEH